MSTLLNSPRNEIRAIVVDDERLAREDILALISPYSQWQVVAEADCGQSAIDRVLETSPDVMFLDVQMPNFSGMQVAETLRSLGELPFTIFVSAYSEYALPAFDVDAVHYLLKPVAVSKFAEAIGRAELALRRSPGSLLESSFGSAAALPSSKSSAGMTFPNEIVIRSIGRSRLIPVHDVLWVKAEGNYVVLNCSKSRILHRQSIAGLVATLDPNKFVRTHRSSIVRVDTVAEVLSIAPGRYRLKLSNGDAVPVSETYRKDVLHRLGIN